MLRVGGSIFFGASHYLQVRLQSLQGKRVVIEAQQIDFYRLFRGGDAAPGGAEIEGVKA